MSVSASELIQLDSCPLCNAPTSQFRTVTEKGDRFSGEKAIICLNCGLVFLNPRMTNAAIDRYYLSNTFSQEVRGSSYPTPEALKYRDMRAERRWRFLENTLPRNRIKCLEIGCSSGNFVRILKNAGYDVTGVDPSEGFVEYAQSQELNCLVGNFPEALPDKEPYDMIFMFHVLEHVAEPLEILKSIRKYLKDDGKFIIEYPDIALAAERLFLPPTYFQKAHLYDFNEDTLATYFAEAGFEIEHAFYEEKVHPYDRNILLIVKPASPKTTSQWSSEKASSLHSRLLRKISMYQMLSIFRPAWHLYRRLGGR